MKRVAQQHLIRDVVGNLFRPVAVGPALRTPTTVQLAQAAYDEQALPRGHIDPARLAVQADALEATARRGRSRPTCALPGRTSALRGKG